MLIPNFLTIPASHPTRTLLLIAVSLYGVKMNNEQSLLWKEPFHLPFIISAPLLQRLPFCIPSPLSLTLGSPKLLTGNTQAPGSSWLRQNQIFYRTGEICLVWPRNGFVSLQLVGKSNLISEEDRFTTWADTWLPMLCCNERWNRSSGGLGGHQAGFLMTVPSDFQCLSEAGWGDQRALHCR